MRICHINLAKGRGGGEHQTLRLMLALQESGAAQVLVAHKKGWLAAEADRHGIPVRRIGHFVRGHLRPGAWDLLHCHDGKSVYWAFLEHQARRTPYVITRRVLNTLHDRHLTRSAYRAAHRVVCVSNAVEDVVQACVPGARTHVVPDCYASLPADARQVASIRQRYRGRILVGQVGSLEHHKGFHVTIDAARQLAQSQPSCHFLLLGDGPQRQALQEYAANLPNIEFLGYRDDVGTWLAALDIFVFPSLSEGLGSSILEAMHHGVPVVGSAIGGIPDLVEDGVTGLLVPPASTQSLARTLTTLLTLPALREELARRAKARLARFAPGRVLASYQALYRTATQNDHVLIS